MVPGTVNDGGSHHTQLYVTIIKQEAGKKDSQSDLP